MKKSSLLNQPISSVVAGMGHLDTLVIADAGLPIPSETRRIDLALTAGIPGFLDTVRAVLTELKVERAIVAEEMMDVSPAMYRALADMLGAERMAEFVGTEIPVKVIEVDRARRRLILSHREAVRTLREPR